jgi:signal transduction histidine kinase
MLERAKLRARSLMDLVNDLLLFAKLESKKVVRKKELWTSRRSSRAPSSSQGSGFDEGRVVLCRDTRETALIEADRSEMEQLFTNLVSNAMKYMSRTARSRSGPCRSPTTSA